MGEILGNQVSGTAAVGREDWAKQLDGRMDGLSIQRDEQTARRLAVYHQMLTEWNEKMNLTGDADFAAALDRHYADSLAPLALPGLFPKGASLIDVGTGAGFPGLALAIARPDLSVTLMDALNKRLQFLRAVADELGLRNVALCHARAEDGGRAAEHRERYDLAVARAVASMPVLMELLLPFVRVGGKALCYKGPAAAEEWEAGARAAKLVGGGAPEKYPIFLPCQPEWEHSLIAVPKTQKTVRLYPRKAGTPGKSPLGAAQRP